MKQILSKNIPRFVTQILAIVAFSVSPVLTNAAGEFPLDVSWAGATQWMGGVNNGFEAYGGSVAKGIDVFGSSIQTSDYVPVKIVFETDTTLWTLSQVFRRDMSHNSFGVGKFPGSAWDMSDTSNPRRLNICFEEHNDGPGPIPAPNLRWDPDSSQFGKYELLFIMNSDYDGTGTTYSGINILLGDPDVLYGWWPKLIVGHPFLESIPSSLSIFPRIELTARQQGYNVLVNWFSPGPAADSFKLYLGVESLPDSLIASFGSDDSVWTHNGVTSGLEFHYLLKSFDLSGNEILTSREESLFINALPPISAVFPVSQEIQADTLTDIIVTFDSVMNPASINSSSFKVFGHWSGPKFGTHQMENGNTQVRFTPNEPFSAGEWVLASLAKTVETINGTDLPSGYAWNFWIKTKPATLNLTEIDQIEVREEGEEHIQCYGAYGGDINDDGYSDITVVNEITDDIRLFLNDGTGGYSSFTTTSLGVNGVPSPNDGGDFNSDGKIDLAIGASQSNQLRVVMNNGSGGYTGPTSYTTGNNNRGVAVLDLNGDGHSDITTCSWGASKVYKLLNNGNGTFAAAVQIETGSSGEWACAAGDANNDGILDLFVGAQSGQDIILLLGDGNGGLVFSTSVNSGGATWMLATGDINGDGNIDVASANSSSDNASVIFGDGTGGLSDPVTYPTPAFALAIDLGDIDGDGDLEMVTSSYGGGEWRVFENDGAGNYINPLDYPATTAASCMTLHDRDRDGVMDLTGIDEIADLIFLFEPATGSCCSGLRGDLNGDGNNCNIIDLNFLVNFIFRGSANPGPCALESDVNGNGTGPNVIDLNYVVNFIFRGGTPPPACP
ncbi:MAG TPA: FG-GAP-like repeat-containing protein [candidate division Zixibacteria bacterium]|nr:FG-GAP-like repeat-containing protein [candidate division Zixibacteria bacterium]